MSSRRLVRARGLRAVALLSTLGLGCAAEGTGGQDLSVDLKVSGLVQVQLSVDEDVHVEDVRFAISGRSIDRLTGVMRIEQDTHTVRAVLRLPAGSGYKLNINASEIQTGAPCASDTSFDVAPDETTDVELRLQCDDALEVDAGLDGSVSADIDSQVDPEAVRTEPVAQTDEPAEEDAQVVGTLVDAARPDAATASHDSGLVDPYADSGLSECEICSRQRCADTRGINRLRDCFMAVGAATTGPAKGVAKAALCTALVECAHRTSCVSPDHEECFCGEGVSREDCRTLGPMGVCRSEYAAAGETIDATKLTMGFMPINLALGVGSRVLACESELCSTQCFPNAQL